MAKIETNYHHGFCDQFELVGCHLMSVVPECTYHFINILPQSITVLYGIDIQLWTAYSTNLISLLFPFAFHHTLFQDEILSTASSMIALFNICLQPMIC